MKNVFLIIVLFIHQLTYSQFYYKDILGAGETNAQIKSLIASGIRTVSLKSYESDGSPSEQFDIRQEVSRNPVILKTISRTGQEEDRRESFLISLFNDKLQLVRTSDSSSGFVNVSEYDYDINGQITRITTQTKDSAGRVVMSEIHDWVYNNSGKAEKMIRWKNGVLMDEIRFVYDAAGNMIEEQTLKNAVMTQSVYYYYNDKNQLTDIVRYNENARRLLPDYLFEYSADGKMIQKITVPGNSSDYLIWRYQYDQRGLKTKEACYNKEKKLLGRIDYSYLQ